MYGEVLAGVLGTTSKLESSWLHGLAAHARSCMPQKYTIIASMYRGGLEDFSYI